MPLRTFGILGAFLLELFEEFEEFVLLVSAIVVFRGSLDNDGLLWLVAI